MTTLADIVRDEGLEHHVKADRVAQALFGQPDRGVGEATAFFRSARDGHEARYPAAYLGLLADVADAKRRLVELALAERRDLLDAVTLALRSVPEKTVEAVVRAYVEDPDESTYPTAFEAALFFPQLVRRHRGRIDDDDLALAMLPGSDDTVVDELERRYRDRRDPDTLRALSKIRTDRALSALTDLRDAVPDTDRESLDLYLESSGVFPDTQLASVYFHAFRGFVVPRDESPHAMGRGFDASRPVCPICDTPTTRILSLEPEPLELDLRAAPSFFWFSCDHEALEFVYVSFAGAEPEGLMVPMAAGEPDAPIVPDAALLLEEHPNQHGYGIEVGSGFALHQVGGFPPWTELDRHPACPTCGQSMRFLAAVDSGETVLGSMRFTGLLYGFWCDGCAVSCTTWQNDALF